MIGVEALHKSLRSMTASRRVARAAVLAGLTLAAAVALGGGVAVALRGTGQSAVLACLGLCGTLGAACWGALRLPVVSVLRVALIASFWFRLEVELFPIIKQGHGLPFGLNVSLKLLLALALAAALRWRRRGDRAERSVWPLPFTLSIAALFLCGAFSVLYGVETVAGLYSLFGLATAALICFVVAAHFGTVKSLHAMLLSLAAAVTFNAALGVLQYAEIFEGWKLLGSTVDDARMTIPGSEISRASGLLEMSNSFGWYLASFLPVLLAPALIAGRSLKKWARRFLVAAFLLGVLALVLTFSRGSWAAFAATMPLLAGVALAARPPRERWALLRRFAGVLMILVALSAPFLNAVATRITQDDQGAAESRLPLMQVAFEMIKANPVFGVGLGSYEAAMRRYDETEDFISESFPFPVHNMFLHIAAEAGIPALVCLLVITGLALACGWRVWRDRSGVPLTRALAVGLMTGVLAYLLTGLKEPSSLDAGQIRLLFLLCGLLIANERAARRAAAESRTAERSAA